MSWVRRPREDRDIYAPNECPSYASSPELFTIKLHHGGSTADDGATADDEANADGGTDDAQTHTPTEGSQGGVFNMQQPGGSTARPSPLGIDPLQFKTRGNATVTSLRNLELARRKREARAKLKPVWKH
ncbi:hypothetical protein ACET3Z_012680 [Daucus carota]